MDLFAQIEVLRFDRIAFAHSLSTQDYAFSLENRGYGIYGKTPENGGVLEIGFVEKNPLVLTTALGEFLLEEDCIFMIPPNCSFTARVATPGPHRHTSVEFLLSCNSRIVPEFRLPEGCTLTLPLVIPPSSGNNELFALIRSVVHSKTAQPDRSYFEECADFMLLMSKLSQLAWTATTGSGISPGNRRYCQRAKAYISEHIHRKITVGQIADALGISKNYLTNIFKDTEHISLMEYINRRKLSHMLELMRRYGYSISQGAECVGFSDANYVSRIFKRYYGVTIREYRQEENI